MSKKQTAQPVPEAPAGLIPVVVANQWRAVVFGYAKPEDLHKPEHLDLKRARNIYYWAPADGAFDLALRGPQPGSKVGARADVTLFGITAVLYCTPEARLAWEAATWGDR